MWQQVGKIFINMSLCSRVKFVLYDELDKNIQRKYVFQEIIWFLIILFIIQF